MQVEVAVVRAAAEFRCRVEDRSISQLVFAPVGEALNACGATLNGAGWREGASYDVTVRAKDDGRYEARGSERDVTLTLVVLNGGTTVCREELGTVKVRRGQGTAARTSLPTRLLGVLTPSTGGRTFLMV